LLLWIEISKDLVILNSSVCSNDSIKLDIAMMLDSSNELLT